MRTATGIIKRSPDACWRTLVDPSLLTGWVPKLSRARVEASYPTGLAREIRFEFLPDVSYSLLFTYNVAAFEMRWKPLRGAHAIAGFARVEPFEQGAKLTYAVDPVKPDQAAPDVDVIVKQFTTWMHAY